LKVALTYNLKKQIEEDIIETHLTTNNTKKFVDEHLSEKYSHRLSDVYAEWDDEETVNAIKDALASRGHDVILIEADEDAFEKLRNEKPDIVFNIAEGAGGAGRESYIPSMCEMLDIPHTASDAITVGLCHDKSRCKEILSYHNVPTPGFFITDENVSKELKYPKFVKPLHEGSSKGIYNSCVVYNRNQLNTEIKRIAKNYSQPSIIEDFIDGREFTIAMLGNGDNKQVLPIVEINLNTLPKDFPKIYSYEVKWFFDTRENKLDIFKCPADISDELKKKIEDICLKAYKSLRIRDWARLDVRCDKEENPYIIEINPLPGILPNPDDNSCFPKAAREIGMDYDTLINRVLELAAERYQLNEK
jgi:D-alanine-D-alanine ligase